MDWVDRWLIELAWLHVKWTLFSNFVDSVKSCSNVLPFGMLPIAHCWLIGVHSRLYCCKLQVSCCPLPIDIAYGWERISNHSVPLGWHGTRHEPSHKVEQIKVGQILDRKAIMSQNRNHNMTVNGDIIIHIWCTKSFQYLWSCNYTNKRNTTYVSLSICRYA